MNFKKALLTFSMIPFLASCNANSSIAGTYGFQMGKEAGTHFGIFLELTDNTYTATDVSEEGLKEFNISLNIKNGKEEEDSSAVKDILAWFGDEEGASFKGYYKVTDEKNKEGETLLILGLSFTYLIDRIKESYEAQMGEPLPDEVNDLVALGDEELVHKLLYATYKTNMVNIYLPVSISDAVYQLYWYGVDIQAYYTDPNDITTFTFGIEHSTVHDFGTKPTAEEVATINETYPEKHNGMSFMEVEENYRVFHQLKMGLSKK